MDAHRTAEVACHLTAEVRVPSVLVLHVAAASTVATDAEVLSVRLGDDLVEPTELVGPHGGRLHVLDLDAGRLTIDYRASTTPEPGPVDVQPGDLSLELIEALRQSRYCPSDLLEGLLRSHFGDVGPGSALAHEIGSWVFEHTQYVRGVSRPTDSAVDTLLAGAGVCRDFAHLTISLCRAAGIPARLTSAYAPGLSPMDFHAVAEVWGDEGWEVVDATRLAPRASLVRIATGRDAADTAFLTTIRGDLELIESAVTAVAGTLPLDRHDARVTIA